MTDSPSSSSTTASPQITPKEAVEWVQSIGQALNMAILYGVAHKVAQMSIERGFPAILSLVGKYGSLHISIVEGDLLVNGASAQGAPLTGALIQRLTSRNLLSFVMEAGLSLDEYRAFLALLVAPVSAATPAGESPISGTLALQHIIAQNVTYKRVVEGEPEAATLPENAIAMPADLANVVALLKGDPAANQERGREDVRQLAEDAEKLAELVLRSANIRDQAANLETGESLTDLVVGCINRLTGTLTQTPGARTQKGRKQTKRTLLMLEEKLLSQLHELAGDSVDREAIEAAFAEATESLDVETLAAKYMKSRRAAEKAEARMRKLIQQVEDSPEEADELRGRLMEQGLDAEGWEELMISRKSSAAPPPPSGSEIKEIKTLTLLLAQLGETLAQPKAQPSDQADAQLKTLISETGAHVQALASGTEKKIDVLRSLADGVPDAKAAAAPTPLSRKALLTMLAEIAQELSQPLTIMSATLDMLLTQRSGPLTAAQSELLSLAADSGARLGHLVTCLMKVAGTPTSLHPDQDMLREAYRTGQRPPLVRPGEHRPQQ